MVLFRTSIGLLFGWRRVAALLFLLGAWRLFICASLVLRLLLHHTDLLQDLEQVDAMLGISINNFIASDVAHILAQDLLA